MTLEKQDPIEPQEIAKLDLSKSMIKDPIFFAEKILSTKAVTGSLTIPVQMHTTSVTKSVTTTIPFYLGNDFSLGSITSKWADMVNMDFANNFTEVMNAISSYDGESQVSMQSENMSSKTWKGSDFDGFSVECLFLSTRRTINPLKIIKEIAACALPSNLVAEDTTTAQSFVKTRDTVAGVVKSAGDWIGTNLASAFNNSAIKDAVSKGTNYLKDNVQSVGMVAPLYYGLKMDDNGKMVPLNNTTVTLQVGEWFRAPQLLVSSISNITMSKEVIAPPTSQNKKGGRAAYDNSAKGSDYGYPLWAKCSLKLIPHTIMTKERFQSYLLFPHDDKTSPLNALESLIANKIGGIKNAVDTFNSFKLP